MHFSGAKNRYSTRFLSWLKYTSKQETKVHLAYTLIAQDAKIRSGRWLCKWGQIIGITNGHYQMREQAMQFIFLGLPLECQFKRSRLFYLSLQLAHMRTNSGAQVLSDGRRKGKWRAFFTNSTIRRLSKSQRRPCQRWDWALKRIQLHGILCVLVVSQRKDDKWQELLASRRVTNEKSSPPSSLRLSYYTTLLKEGSRHLDCRHRCWRRWKQSLQRGRRLMSNPSE